MTTDCLTYRDLFDLKNDVVVQLGFRGPIGRQFASIFAESGATLVLGDIDIEGGAKIVDELKKLNERVESFKIDVTSEAEVRELVSYVKGRQGKISALVNTFSKQPTDFNKKFEESNYESWKAVLETNLSAMYLVCREFGKWMINQKYGSIINIASFLGVVAPDQRIYGGSGLNSPAVYTASKNGVIGLTKYLAAYLGPHHVRVNAISPGGVNPGGLNEEFIRNYSDRVPLGRMANMDDLKGPVIFLASRASQYVNGHNLVVDGGLSIW